MCFLFVSLSACVGTRLCHFFFFCPHPPLTLALFAGFDQRASWHFDEETELWGLVGRAMKQDTLQTLVRLGSAVRKLRYLDHHRLPRCHLGFKVLQVWWCAKNSCSTESGVRTACCKKKEKSTTCNVKLSVYVYLCGSLGFPASLTCSHCAVIYFFLPLQQQQQQQLWEKVELNKSSQPYQFSAGSCHDWTLVAPPGWPCVYLWMCV